jgi:magnesium transporter
MAVGEVRLRDWWRVARREFAMGLTLGAGLALLGLLRVIGGDMLGFEQHGLDYFRLAFAVSLSLLAVVVWGTLVGSMLPFLLQRVGLDPASASAPLISTLSDVTGLLIYFTVASLIIF